MCTNRGFVAIQLCHGWYADEARSEKGKEKGGVIVSAASEFQKNPFTGRDQWSTECKSVVEWVSHWHQSVYNLRKMLILKCDSMRHWYPDIALSPAISITRHTKVADTTVNIDIFSMN